MKLQPYQVDLVELKWNYLEQPHQTIFLKPHILHESLKRIIQNIRKHIMAAIQAALAFQNVRKFLTARKRKHAMFQFCIYLFDGIMTMTTIQQ